VNHLFFQVMALAQRTADHLVGVFHQVFQQLANFIFAGDRQSYSTPNAIRIHSPFQSKVNSFFRVNSRF
ncbi:hypothetical protein L9G74_21215, partial [Shewanella sp. C32]